MVSPTPPTSALSFSFFPQLATELRLKVWTYAIQPRTISICYLPTTDICSSASPVPALLHTSREARYEALRYYNLCFGTHKSPPQIYFAPRFDTIYLPRYRAMGYDETLRDFKEFMREPRDLDAVRRLGLDFVEGDVKRPWEAYDKAVLIKSFPHLEKIYLVLGLKRRLRERDGGAHNVMPTVFVPPKEDAREIFRVWTEFRDSFAREERLLSDMDFEHGRACVPYVLPPVEVVARRLEGGTRYDEM